MNLNGEGCTRRVHQQPVNLEPSEGLLQQREQSTERCIEMGVCATTFGRGSQLPYETPGRVNITEDEEELEAGGCRKMH